MRFNLQTLPKLAVSAKLLCLLMVVMCGAVPSTRSVRLYNDCSSSDVRIDMKGRVLADDIKSNKFRNLTIRSQNFNVKLTIFAEESKRYLCFNRNWKLVGSKRFRGEMCQFYEEMLEIGYNRYRSVADESRYIGFNKKGRPLRDRQQQQQIKAAKSAAHDKCLNFLKFDTDFSIGEHNRRMSGSGVITKSDAETMWRSRSALRLRHHNHHRNFIGQS
ncbi:fibroblast growth factor 18 isoform X1 [Nilaparvata lugens]|uniref:fibroblast growth factor 18 isoform X1 n=1 Tax=Nilaparvata lugens TaxID=108931 RepID=UPI000B98A416|nr:fibroblast growth factor 18 isoform X1 [Nilaparvata lugens]